ncbi:MAG TPA: hypothetical protein VFD59_04240 [Nocardioidaceae bacterium]|nr:hypothetical protein [Nocardioidaceae bacterium]
MTTRDDVGSQAPEEVSKDQRRGRLSAALKRTIALVLALILVASAVGVGVLFYLRGQVESELDERADVARAAEQFVVQFNTYDSGSVDSYVESVNPMLTTSAKTKFATAMEEILSLIEETELKSDGELLASGVAHVDPDDASVLVAVDAAARSLAGPVQRHFRWEIDLNKVDGEWLVDDFNPVAAEAVQ